MKKILAVATALVLAISSLCVFVVADDTFTVSFSDVSVTGRWSSSTTYPANSDGSLTWTFTSNYSEIWFELPSSVTGTVTSVTLNDVTMSDGSTSDLCVKVYGDGTEVVTSYNSSSATLTQSQIDTMSTASTVNVGIMSNLSSTTTISDVSAGVTVTIGSVTVTTEDTSSSSTTIHTWTSADNYTITDYSSYLTDSYSSGDTITITATLESDGYFNGTIGANGSDGWGSMSDYFVSNDGSSITATYSFVVGSEEYAQIQVWYMSGTSVKLTSLTIDVTPASSTRNQGVIYINEDYHGIFVTRTIGTSTRKYLVNVPHTVDSTGYCTVCKEYVGGEETEASTTTIDGVEYEEAYTVDVSLGSSNGWGQLDLGDTALIDALSTEGALLVITRDGVSDTVHNGSETYEKFGLVNSWWSGEWIALGTAGHTSATEEGTIDCISDDGTTVIYDGATVYAEWVARGMNAGGTVELISNTSNTLKITNVTVYVPAGTVVTETVDVDEPAEDTNTETEDDELDVDDDDAEEVTETNPTTGAVLALVPMAIAGFAVVASKRK